MTFPYKFLFFGLLLSCFVTASATADQSPARKGSGVVVDTASKVALRSFSSQSLQSYRGDRQFRYDDSKGEVTGWWDRIRHWFWRAFEKLIHVATDTLAGRLALCLLVICAIVLIAKKMTGTRPGGLLDRGQQGGLHGGLNAENIHEIDIEGSIRAAVAANNLRLAVRLWYLKTLKILADKEVIQWKPGKTNQEYLEELSATPYARDFDRLTRDFEYCWYGEATVESAGYEALQQQFSTFNQQLS